MTRKQQQKQKTFKNNKNQKQQKPKQKSEKKPQRQKVARKNKQKKPRVNVNKGNVNIKINKVVRRVDSGARRLAAPAPGARAAARQTAIVNHILRPGKLLTVNQGKITRDGRLEATGTAQLSVIPTNAIVFDGVQFDVPNTSGYQFMRMAEAFMMVGARAASPNYASQGVDGTLGPVSRKFYLLWAMLTALRQAGCLVSSTGNDVMSLFPDFPSGAMLPVGWLNYIRGYMPYVDRNGTPFSFVFTINPSNFTTTFSGAIGTSGNVFINNSICGHPTYAVVGTSPNSEYCQFYTLTGTKTFASIMTQDVDLLSEYWQSVYPCAPYSKLELKAPDASAYVIFERACACATSEFNENLVPLYVVQNSTSLTPPATFIKTPDYTARESGLMSMNVVADDQACIVMNYAIMALDYSVVGSIERAHAASPWAPATTFAPNLINADLRFLNEIVFAANEAYATSSGQAAALMVILWSKFARACFKSGLFATLSTSGGRNTAITTGSGLTGVFDDLPVPPAFMEYLSGFGPVISGGRVVWPVFGMPTGESSTVGQKGWMSVLTGGQTGAQTFNAGYMYTPNLQSTGAPSIGGIVFSAANFPGSNVYVPQPEFLADNFIEEYVNLTGYQNFIPCEVTRFGLVDVLSAANVQITQRNSGQITSKNGLLLWTLYDVEYILAPRILTSADVVRIAHHCYRTTDGSGSVLRTYPHRSGRLRLTGPTYTMARFFSSGSGFTLMNEELAQREAETEYGVSVGGMTQPTETHEENNLFTVRSIANEFFSEGAEKLIGMDFKSIGATATEALWATGKLVASEFIPFAGPILDAAESLTKPIIEKVFKRDVAPVVHRPTGRDTKKI